MLTPPLPPHQSPFDLTSTAFLIVAFLTGIAGALQTPTLSLFLTNEVHARPAMVGFFFTGAPSLASWSASFWPGVPTEKGDRKSLIVFLLSAGRFRLRVVCLEPQLFHSAVCWGVPEQLRLDRQPDVRPLPREHADRTGREAVMFSSILRAQVSLAWVIGPRSPTHWQ